MTWTREQPCYDATDRERVLRVLLTDHNAIGIHTPPGNFAGLTVVQAHLYRQHIADAIAEAARRTEGTLAAAQYGSIHDLLDYDDHTRRLVVSARDGWVNIAVSGWCKAEPDGADELANSIRAASAVARYQRRPQ